MNEFTKKILLRGAINVVLVSALAYNIAKIVEDIQDYNDEDMFEYLDEYEAE